MAHKLKAVAILTSRLKKKPSIVISQVKSTNLWLFIVPLAYQFYTTCQNSNAF